MAFLVLSEAEVSPPAKRILYEIAVSIAVVGGENAIQRHRAEGLT